MTTQAIIEGKVTFTPGEGVPIDVPLGPVELSGAPDSVTLHWTDENGAAGTAAIPRDQYERYVREGKIRPAN